jgi:hypothetical protein
MTSTAHTAWEGSYQLGLLLLHRGARRTRNNQELARVGKTHALMPATESMGRIFLNCVG